MNESELKRDDTIEVFKKCGTCSQTFGHLLNREFGYPKDAEVRALDPLAGGLMNQGHQCGMLWGATLAIGAEAFRRHENYDDAIRAAITASQNLLDSFVDHTNTVDCREIIGIDLSRPFGMAKFVVKTTLQGTKNNPCYNLAEQWTPDAIKSATEGLSQEPHKLKHRPISCASEVAKKMGASDEEMIMVSGFAGGLGLSGNACGGLSAAIWMKTLAWCKDNPGKNPPYFNNKNAKRIMKRFYEETKSEIACRKICNRRFNDIDEHSIFIQNGGCNELMNLLATS